MNKPVTSDEQPTRTTTKVVLTAGNFFQQEIRIPNGYEVVEIDNLQDHIKNKIFFVKWCIRKSGDETLKSTIATLFLNNCNNVSASLSVEISGNATSFSAAFNAKIGILRRCSSGLDDWGLIITKDQVSVSNKFSPFSISKIQ